LKEVGNSQPTASGPLAAAIRHAARVVTFPGIGHAPALNVPAQIGLVADFFAA
jgi:pimeloyl-ACP methyl ester carboxylesterase